MNCPYCAKEMETGYLRGGSGYELLWTEEPFKMTSLLVSYTHLTLPTKLEV